MGGGLGLLVLMGCVRPLWGRGAVLGSLAKPVAQFRGAMPGGLAAAAIRSSDSAAS
ncbi:hypothetical protein OG753_04125 [Streptomyces sp. NBC_00029]|uniref:hypothetical protein n=1 Tax=Streptomyces sp. NBC_00029 TaxID=2903613 RepID=UPI003244C18F